ncbi:MAG TPA: hypothetical protein VNB68_02060, partial [Nitrososphaeraceae archaeon]|nr:hypothetical protein [Nitrososphaeraceae archaeon]
MLNIRCASSISALTGEIVYSQGTPNNEDKCKISEAFIVDCNKEYVLRYTATDSSRYSNTLILFSKLFSFTN